jgi:hypothetical protein
MEMHYRVERREKRRGQRQIFGIVVDKCVGVEAEVVCVLPCGCRGAV